MTRGRVAPPLIVVTWNEMCIRDRGNNKEQPTREQAEATRLGILHQLIDDEILQQAAKKMNLVASDEEVDAKPVSYTHLDVYKRQTRERCLS